MKAGSGGGYRLYENNPPDEPPVGRPVSGGTWRRPWFFNDDYPDERILEGIEKNRRESLAVLASEVDLESSQKPAVTVRCGGSIHSKGRPVVGYLCRTRQGPLWVPVKPRTNHKEIDEAGVWLLFPKADPAIFSRFYLMVQFVCGSPSCDRRALNVDDFKTLGDAYRRAERSGPQVVIYKHAGPN